MVPPVTRWVVVGGGTAGCVVAARLSERPGNQVTVLEAGPVSTGPASASYLDDLAAPGALWPGITVTDGDGLARAYPQGRGLGGSSAVNGGVLSGASRVGILPSELVGPAELGVIDRALLAAAPAAAPARLSRHHGRRASSADVYLRPALNRANLRVVAGAHVDRVLTRGRVAVGVALASGERFDADRVVCTAGALHTPGLLLRSGVRVTGIGDGLTDHPSRMVEATLRPGTGDDPAGLVTGVALRRGTIEIVTMNHLGRRRPDTAALLVGVLRTSRRGTVRLDPQRADDPCAAPVADCGPLDAADSARLAEGVAYAEAVLTSAPLREVVVDVHVVPELGGYVHAASSCRMGTVVDADGAVAGYTGLFIADASVLPTLPESGTYVPVVTMAERLSARWR